MSTLSIPCKSDSSVETPITRTDAIPLINAFMLLFLWVHPWISYFQWCWTADELDLLYPDGRNLDFETDTQKGFYFMIAALPPMKPVRKIMMILWMLFIGTRSVNQITPTLGLQLLTSVWHYIGFLLTSLQLSHFLMIAGFPLMNHRGEKVPDLFTHKGGISGIPTLLYFLELVPSLSERAAWARTTPILSIKGRRTQGFRRRRLISNLLDKGKEC